MEPGHRECAPERDLCPGNVRGADLWGSILTIPFLLHHPALSCAPFPEFSVDFSVDLFAQVQLVWEERASCANTGRVFLALFCGFSLIANRERNPNALHPTCHLTHLPSCNYEILPYELWKTSRSIKALLVWGVIAQQSLDCAFQETIPPFHPAGKRIFHTFEHAQRCHLQLTVPNNHIFTT